MNDIIQKWGTQEVSFAFSNLQDNDYKCDLKGLKINIMLQISL